MTEILNSWIFYTALIIVLAVLLDRLPKFISDKANAHTDKTGNYRLAILFTALRAPLRLLIWVTAAHLIASMLIIQKEFIVLEKLGVLWSFGYVIAVAWFAVRLVKEIERSLLAGQLASGRSLDRSAVDALSKVLLLTIYIIATLAFLQVMGVTVAGILAFGGVGGIAIGFAARDLLANFFGGLMIYMDRPFVIGDWIRSPDRQIEGIVEEIGWRSTCIRSFEKLPLYVPNALFNTMVLENPSRMSNRRIHEYIGISYDNAEQMQEITAAVKKMLQGHDEVDQQQVIIVAFDKFSDSSLNFFVYFMTKTTDWIHYHEVKEDLLLQIYNIIQQHGAQCAYPTTTLHVPEPLLVANAAAGGKG